MNELERSALLRELKVERWLIGRPVAGRVVWEDQADEDTLRARLTRAVIGLDALARRYPRLAPELGRLRDAIWPGP